MKMSEITKKQLETITETVEATIRKVMQKLHSDFTKEFTKNFKKNIGKIYSRVDNVEGQLSAVEKKVDNGFEIMKRQSTL